MYRLEDIKKEKTELTEQLVQLKKFVAPMEPPRPAEIRKALSALSSVVEKSFVQLVKGVPLLLIGLARGEAQEKRIQQLLEKLEVKVVVYPADTRQRFTLNVLVKAPIKRHEIDDKVMVSPSSWC